MDGTVKVTVKFFRNVALIGILYIVVVYLFSVFVNPMFIAMP